MRSPARLPASTAPHLSTVMLVASVLLVAFAGAVEEIRVPSLLDLSHRQLLVLKQLQLTAQSGAEHSFNITHVDEVIGSGRERLINMAR